MDVTELIGYLALAAGIVAMTMKNILTLRIIHSVSAALYVAYGFLMGAQPILVGGSLFLMIHAWKIHRQAKKPVK